MIFQIIGLVGSYLAYIQMKISANWNFKPWFFMGHLWIGILSLAMGLGIRFGEEYTAVIALCLQIIIQNLLNAALIIFVLQSC